MSITRRRIVYYSNISIIYRIEYKDKIKLVYVCGVYPARTDGLLI